MQGAPGLGTGTWGSTVLPSCPSPSLRELLTDHRVPGLLLEAMKVAVKKQRKKIKAKMLGTPEEAESRFTATSQPSHTP